MKQRVTTAVIALLALGAVLFLVPPVAAQIVFAVVIVAGAWEWSAFLRAGSRTLRFFYIAVIAALLAAVTFLPNVDAILLLKASLVWWFASLIWIFFYPTGIASVVRWLGGVCVLVPLYLALIELYRIAPTWLLVALLIVWAADSGAYLAGKLVGRVKLAPSISPGKTWEGVIGGLVGVVLLVLLLSFWINVDLRTFVPFCLAIAGLSIVGDLTVSMFKRSVGLKDSGALFPGHGGVLDRIDSVAAAAPLFALGATWTGVQ